MLKFSFANLHIDPDTTPHHELETPIGQVANFFADFRVTAGGTEIYADDSFPIVEFASQLARWLRDKIERGDEFSFESMFFEEPGEFSIALRTGHWKASSKIHPSPTGEFSTGELKDSACTFLDKLRERCKDDFNVELVAF
ncbi:hypothetical protein GCM10010420_47820 [Streptomyces glaucosporus]|uniref:DUF7878 domain-containing protein n=1 Tax=Streptomyces glaucosporus TaxID=284044 RepID=A0ABN3ISP5_9ACTN